MPFVEIPRDIEEKRHWIRWQMARMGVTFAAVGRELGITRQTARSVLFKSYPRIERVLAAKLGYPCDVLWPERYLDPPAQSYTLTTPDGEEILVDASLAAILLAKVQEEDTHAHDPEEVPVCLT